MSGASLVPSPSHALSRKGVWRLLTDFLVLLYGLQYTCIIVMCSSMFVSSPCMRYIMYIGHDTGTSWHFRGRLESHDFPHPSVLIGLPEIQTCWVSTTKKGLGMRLVRSTSSPQGRRGNMYNILRIIKCMYVAIQTPKPPKHDVIRRCCT
jgi:hypothetical protein